MKKVFQFIREEEGGGKDNMKMQYKSLWTEVQEQLNNNVKMHSPFNIYIYIYY